VIPQFDATQRNDQLVLATLARHPDWINQRVRSRLIAAGECLVWTGALHASGYGTVLLPADVVRPRRKVRVGTHRAVYLAEYGEIPYGLVIDHLCRNKICANPKHLESVTTRINTLRGETLAAMCLARTTCPQGHRLGGDNVTPSNVAKRRRTCRECARDLGRRRTDLLSAAAQKLGISPTRYRDLYGQSMLVARRFIEGGEVA
jgi:hypothetical protein